MRPTADVARELGIVEGTACSILDRYNEDEEKSLPTKSRERNKAGRKNILNNTHKVFIIQHLENNPITTVVDTMNSLCQKFQGLSITKSALHEYITKECCFSLKRTRKIIDRRNEERSLQARVKSKGTIKITRLMNYPFI